MKVKLYHIKNIDGLFDVIDACKGRVDMVTNEGDRLNLKSKLSQYVSLAKVFSDGEIDELELVAYEPEDAQKLMAFLMDGKSASAPEAAEPEVTEPEK